MRTFVKKKIFFLAWLGLLTAGCSGGGGSSETSATPEAATTLSLPGSISVVGAEESNDSQSLNHSSSLKVSTLAYNDSGTDYDKQEQQFHVYHEAVGPLQTVNSILCFIGQLFPNPEDYPTQFLALVDNDPYIALVDDAKCESQSGSSSGPSQDSASSGSSGESSSKQLVKATVRVKSKNGDGKMPILVQLWFVENHGPNNSQMMIKAEAEARAGKSDTRPIGDFSIYFKMYPMTGDVASSESFGGGELSIATGSSSYPMAFTFMEAMSFQGSGESKNSAVQMDYEGNNGIALVTATSTWDNNSNKAYAIAYANSGGSKYLSSASGDTVASLSGATPICQDMNNLKSMVWDYGFYNSSDGSKVDMSAGFSCLWDANGDSNYQEGVDKHCWIGYHGVWAEPSETDMTNGKFNHEFSDGAVVLRKDWSNPANDQQYTLKVSPGKLVRHEIKEKPLADLVGVDLQMWDCDNTGCFAYIVNYLPSGGSGAGFYKVAKRVWSQNGPPTDTDITAAKIVTQNGERLYFWAEQLSGSVQFVHGASSATMEEQETVTPSSSFFASSPVTLKCLGDCPIASITSSSLTSPNVPYEDFGASGNRWPNNMTDVTDTNITYTISNANDSDWMRLKRSGTAVAFANGVTSSTLQSNGYWNIRSGALVTDTSVVAEPWLIYSTVGAVFYTYEMGFDSWNQTILAKDSQGNFVNFDKPILMNYTHTTANDRNNNDAFNGQKYRLEWTGDHLNGLPWVAEDTNNDDVLDHKDRWLPQIALKDGVTLGDSNQYVIKARFGEYFMDSASDSNSCSGLSTALSTAMGLTLPTTAGSPSNAAVDMPTTKLDGSEMGTCMTEGEYSSSCDSY